MPDGGLFVMAAPPDPFPIPPVRIRDRNAIRLSQGHQNNPHLIVISIGTGPCKPAVHQISCGVVVGNAVAAHEAGVRVGYDCFDLMVRPSKGAQFFP